MPVKCYITYINMMFNMYAIATGLQFTVIILLLLSLLLLLLETSSSSSTSSIPHELLKGFSAVPLLTTTTSFQPVLNDPTGNFSLGFLRNVVDLQLAVVHVASSEPLWFANSSASLSDTTRLFFNGSLVLWDPQTGASWSTATNGNRLILLNTSNLVVVVGNNNNNNSISTPPLWESFDFPKNTLVQDQNFTANMSLVSSNNLYKLQLTDTFMGLYANYDYGEEKGSLLYWKRTPLEAKAQIVQGQGPLSARVSTEGYLGMYQKTSKPVDVQKFNSFQQNSSFLILRLEPDGNLKGYYWDVSKSSWLLNYGAITETCDLPNPCGSYSLCTPGGSGCSCLNNETRVDSGGCLKKVDYGGDLCGDRIGGGDSYSVLRRNGVEPQHKELRGQVTTSSLGECELLCQNNCSCWGALYSNDTQVCFVLDYPIETMLGTGDGSKMGYFKVRKGGEKRSRVWVRVGIVVAVLVGVVVIIGVGIFGMRWKRRNGVVVKKENGASPGPYRNLGSASFRSIEMCSSAQ